MVSNDIQRKDTILIYRKAKEIKTSSYITTHDTDEI